MWIKTQFNQLVNLALVQQIKIFGNEVVAYFDIEGNDKMYLFSGDNHQDAKNTLITCAGKCLKSCRLLR